MSTRLCRRTNSSWETCAIRRWFARVVEGIDEVYQLAADMGGAGYIFTGEHDAAVMHNSATINLNTLEFGSAGRGQAVLLFFVGMHLPGVQPARSARIPSARKSRPTRRLRIASTAGRSCSASGCISPTSAIAESQVRVARFHNIFGPQGTWSGGREKAPAALCRKVAEAPDGGEIEIWGDGLQTRSFLYIDECLEAVRRLMDSDFAGPVNIGSEEMVTINQLAEMAMSIAGKKLSIRHIAGPLGVRGRNSDNRLIRERLGWEPSRPLREGMEKTYAWISAQVEAARTVNAG